MAVPCRVAGLALLWLLPARALGVAGVLSLAEVSQDEEELGISLIQGHGRLGKVDKHGHIAVGAVVLGAERRLGNASTCGLSTTIKVDCDKADMGSCGNACCTLEIALDMTPDAVYTAVTAFLSSGGGDGAYQLVPGDMPFGEHPKDNITSLDVPGGWKFIFQGKHTTSGRGYVDTLNFNIRAASGGSSILRAFSISDIHGALGDEGQNYKTLAFMLKAIGVDPASATILHGCGKPLTTTAASLRSAGGAEVALHLSSSSSTCGMNGGVEDCQRTDMGSCGNACCALEVTTDLGARAVYDAIAGFLKSGDASGAFSLVPGKMPFNEHPTDDLSSLKVPGDWQFIFQGQHKTSGRGYIDTLDFNVRSTNHSTSILRAFSKSDLHGSLGDAGQNFKTLTHLLGASGIGHSAKVLYGCASD